MTRPADLPSLEEHERFPATKEALNTVCSGSCVTATSVTKFSCWTPRYFLRTEQICSKKE